MNPLAVRGLRDYWDVSPPGRMNLLPDVKFEWQFTADGNQSFLLKKRRDGKPNDRYIESVLDDLLLQPPRRRASAANRKTAPGRDWVETRVTNPSPKVVLNNRGVCAF